MQTRRGTEVSGSKVIDETFKTIKGQFQEFEMVMTAAQQQGTCRLMLALVVVLSPLALLSGGFPGVSNNALSQPRRQLVLEPPLKPYRRAATSWTFPAFNRSSLPLQMSGGGGASGSGSYSDDAAIKKQFAETLRRMQQLTANDLQELQARSEPKAPPPAAAGYPTLDVVGECCFRCKCDLSWWYDPFCS